MHTVQLPGDGRQSILPQNFTQDFSLWADCWHGAAADANAEQIADLQPKLSQLADRSAAIMNLSIHEVSFVLPEVLGFGDCNHAGACLLGVATTNGPKMQPEHTC